MSLILKNRTTFNSLYELDKSCFTKKNETLVNANKVYPNIVADVEVNPIGVLGGSVAAVKVGDTKNYTEYPAEGTSTHTPAPPLAQSAPRPAPATPAACPPPPAG